MTVENTDTMQRVHVMLYQADVDRINHLFGETVGFSKTIRTIVRAYLKQLDARVPDETEAKS